MNLIQVFFVCCVKMLTSFNYLYMLFLYSPHSENKYSTRLNYPEPQKEGAAPQHWILVN